MRGSCTEKMENHRFRRAENSAFPLCISAEIGNSTSTKYQKTCTLSSHTSACYSIMVLQMVNDNTLEGFHGEKQHTGKLGLQWVWTSHSMKPGANLQELTSKTRAAESVRTSLAVFFFFFFLLSETRLPLPPHNKPLLSCVLFITFWAESRPLSNFWFLFCLGGFGLSTWMSECKFIPGMWEQNKTEQNQTKC